MTSKKENKTHHTSFLAVPLTRLAAFVLNHRVMVLIIGLLFAVASVYLAGSHLRFKNRRLDLINPDSEWNGHWKEYVAKFGSIKFENDDEPSIDEDLYIVIDGENSDDITTAMDLLNARIQQHDDLFYSVFYKIDDTPLFQKGLHRATEEELQGLGMFVESTRGVLQGHWEELGLERMISNGVRPLLAPPDAVSPMVKKESENYLLRLISSLEGMLGPEYSYVSPWPELDIASRRKLPPTTNLHDVPQADKKSMMSFLSPENRGIMPFGKTSPKLLADTRAEEEHHSARQSEDNTLDMLLPGLSGDVLPFGTYIAHYPNFPYAEYPDYVSPEATEPRPDMRHFADTAVGEGHGQPADTAAEFSWRNTSDIAPTYGRVGNESSPGEMMIEGPSNFVPPQDTATAPLPTVGENLHYNLLAGGKTGILMLKLRMQKSEKESFACGTKGIDCLRDMIAQVREEMSGADGQPPVRIQLTGLPVIENDEMRSSENGMSQATILAVVGITVLYIVFFGGLRHPIMAMCALMFGIAWSVGFITLGVGHLNILSISFGVILVGLGIDFGIHLTTRYIECRHQGDDAYKGMIRAVYEVGPGVLTGGITTTVAFAMAGFTDFTGVKELGIITGGGVLLCCLAAFVILPVLIFMLDKNRPTEKLPTPRDPSRLLAYFQFHPMLTLLLVFAMVGVLGYGARYVTYDYNLLNLLPEGLESVEVEHQLLDKTDQGVWFALSMSSDRKELEERARKFRELDCVCMVANPLELVPEENPKRVAAISRIHSALAKIPTEVKPIINSEKVLSAMTKEEMDEELRLKSIGHGFEQMLAYLKQAPQHRSLYHRVESLYTVFCDMEVKTTYLQRARRYHQDLGEDLLARLRTVYSISNPEQPTFDDLPQSLVDRYMAVNPQTGEKTYLLQVFGTGNLWDMDNLKKFVAGVNSVDENATGNPIQTYHCSLEMQKCYIEAAFYALAAVIFFLYLDLRSIRQTLLALLPVGLGAVQLFGIMGYFGISLNAANMIVLPLIIGIGIDDGIHVLHDFRHQHGNKFYRLSQSTCTSVILTSFTTIIGFGTLMISSHRGLQSLGLVLALGIFCCLYTSILILPALLTLFCRFAEDGYAVESREEEEKHITESLMHSHVYAFRREQEKAPDVPPQSISEPLPAVGQRQLPEASSPPPRESLCTEAAPVEVPASVRSESFLPPSEIFRAAMTRMSEASARQVSAEASQPEPGSQSASETQSVKISRYITTPNGEVIHSTTVSNSPLISSFLSDKRAA